jgi:hypothetical protein
MWAKNWLLGTDRCTHLNLLNFIRNDSPEDYKHYFRMSDENLKHVLAKVKLTLSVLVAVWIREPGSGPPTHVRANSEPVASRAPPKALASPAGLVRSRLVAPHTQTSLAHWNPSRAGFASQTPTCRGTFRGVRWKHRSRWHP